MAACCTHTAARSAKHLLGLQLFLLLRGCYSQACTRPVARGGQSVQWPVRNPMLVAPVTLSYNYESYIHPMNAEFKSDGISILVPPDFQAGFNLTNTANGTSEIYALRSMLLRKPGQIPEGASQVLSHTLEVALVHQETTGTGYWATVVIPFEVGNDESADILAHLTDEAELPSGPGEVKPVLVSDARPLELNRVWNGASFFHSWTTLPTSCADVQANARQFLRNVTLTVDQYTFHRLLDALRRAPEAPPVAAPSASWELVGCQDEQGPCAQLAATDLQPQLDQALQVQSTTLATMRNRKDVMDEILVQIQNNTLPSLMSAVAARDNLRNAQAEFESAVTHVNELQNFIWQAGNATWDSDRPAAGAISGGLIWLDSEVSQASLLAVGHNDRPNAALNLLYGASRPFLRRQASQEQLSP